MITTGKAIYSILSANTGVKTLVGKDKDNNYKIYPLIIPEGTVLPCIVYERSFVNQGTKEGTGMSDSTINITILAKSYKETIDLSEAVATALIGYRGGSIRSLILTSGAETYAEGAFIQALTFSIKSV